MTRSRNIRFFAAVAACSLAAVACGSSGTKATKQATGTTQASGTAAPAKTVSVSLGCAPGITGVPLEYAIRNGIDKKHGIQLQCVQVQTGPQLSAAMIAGAINVSGLNPANIFTLLDSGADLVGFQPILDREYFDIIVRKNFPLPDAGAGWQGVMKDLSKAKIGVVARGAAAEDIARGLFSDAGLNPDGATYIATGLPTTTLAAMTNAQIDAALTLEPGVTLAVAQGIATQPFSIAEGTGPPSMNWASLFYAASRKYATDNKDVLRRFQAVYQEGLAWMTDPANHAQVVQLTASYLALSPTVAEKLVTRNVPFFSKATTMPADRYNQVGDFFFQAKKAKKAYHVADYGFNVNG